MDGFEDNSGVIILAATNIPEQLDSALLRSGRFDRRVEVALPDQSGRLSILNIHSQNKPFASDVNLEELAAQTVGMSGADLKNILNEAAILSAR